MRADANAQIFPQFAGTTDPGAGQPAWRRIVRASSNASAARAVFPGQPWRHHASSIRAPDLRLNPVVQLPMLIEPGSGVSPAKIRAEGSRASSRPGVQAPGLFTAVASPDFCVSAAWNGKAAKALCKAIMSHAWAGTMALISATECDKSCDGL